MKCVLNDSKLSKSRMPDLRADLETTEINYQSYKTPQKYNIFDIKSPVQDSLCPTKRVTKASLKIERKFGLTPQ